MAPYYTSVTSGMAIFSSAMLSYESLSVSSEEFLCTIMTNM